MKNIQIFKYEYENLGQNLSKLERQVFIPIYTKIDSRNSTNINSIIWTQQ